jgi:hypothetical protein
VSATLPLFVGKGFSDLVLGKPIPRQAAALRCNISHTVLTYADMWMHVQLLQGPHDMQVNSPSS